MIRLTVKNIIIKKQLKKNFKVPGVLFCTIFVGWFTDVPPIMEKKDIIPYCMDNSKIKYQYSRKRQNRCP